MIKYSDIYEFTTIQENSMTNDISVIDGWPWNFREHVRLSVLYKNSQFAEENTKDQRDWKPFKNIMRPILNLRYRATGFDVKDILIFIEDAAQFYKSFLIRKFHEKWARENKIDTFIDEVVESYIDFGGVLVKKGVKAKPEVIPLQKIVFCDQTNFLSGPFALKHYLNPAELKEMVKKGWDAEAIETLIEHSKPQKIQEKNTQRASETTGEYVEVYEIHGVLPDSFLEGKEEEYTRQVHIISFYEVDKERKGITLYEGREKNEFKFLLKDGIFGRALGFGGAEELFEAQVWTNSSEINKLHMMEAASKIIFKTTDAAYANRNKIKEMQNLEIAVLEEGKDITQIDMTPRSIAIFERSLQEWELHGKEMGSASEAILGDPPTSGTPFKLQELVVNQAKGLHEFHRGKIAIFMDEIYKDWIIPHIAKEVIKDQEFLAELNMEEMREVGKQVEENEVNKFLKEKILNGELIEDFEVAAKRTAVREQFNKSNIKFLKILEKELKDSPISLEINIMGKQKDLSATTDKLVNIFRQLIAAPQILDDSRMVKIFNQILESSNLEPISFSGTSSMIPVQSSEPLKEFTKVNE